MAKGNGSTLGCSRLGDERQGSEGATFFSSAAVGQQSAQQSSTIVVQAGDGSGATGRILEVSTVAEAGDGARTGGAGEGRMGATFTWGIGAEVPGGEGQI
jgi:hypothetical protein